MNARPTLLEGRFPPKVNLTSLCPIDKFFNRHYHLEADQAVKDSNLDRSLLLCVQKVLIQA
jgi:hypothetical protein